MYIWRLFPFTILEVRYKSKNNKIKYRLAKRRCHGKNAELGYLNNELHNVKKDGEWSISVQCTRTLTKYIKLWNCSVKQESGFIPGCDDCAVPLCFVFVQIFCTNNVNMSVSLYLRLPWVYLFLNPIFKWHSRFVFNNWTWTHVEIDQKKTVSV